MTIPAVALSLQTFAFQIKPHLILFSISFPESPTLVSESCQWTRGLFVLLPPHWGGTGRIAFLCYPGGEEQREGAGDGPFPTQMAFTASPRLGEFKEDTLIHVPSFFLYVYVPMHYICVYIHRYVFRWRDKIYININFSPIKTDTRTPPYKTAACRIYSKL